MDKIANSVSVFAEIMKLQDLSTGAQKGILLAQETKLIV